DRRAVDGVARGREPFGGCEAGDAELIKRAALPVVERRRQHAARVDRETGEAAGAVAVLEDEAHAGGARELVHLVELDGDGLIGRSAGETGVDVERPPL